MTTPTTNPVPSSAPQDLLFNAALLDQAVTGTGATVTDRLGTSRMSMQGAIDTLKAFNARGAWLTGTAYALKDVVTTGGIAYAAVLAHTAGTFATDLAAGRWVVHQGVTQARLASTAAGDGAAMVASKRSLTGALLIDLLDVHDSLPVDAVRDYGMSTANTRAQNDAALYAAINSGVKRVFIPAPSSGKYLMSASIQLLAASMGLELIGQNTKNTILSWQIDTGTTSKFALVLDANVKVTGLTLENTGNDSTNSAAVVSSTPTDGNGCRDSEFDLRLIGNWGVGLGATVDGSTLTLARSQFFSNRGKIEFDGVTIPISLGVGCNDNLLDVVFLNNKGNRHIKLLEGANNTFIGRFEPVDASVTTGMLNAELVRCTGTYIRGYMEPCYGFLADASPGTIVDATCEGFNYTIGNLTSSAILRSSSASNAGVFNAPIVSHVRLATSRAASNPTCYAASDDDATTMTLVDAITSRDTNFKKKPVGQSSAIAISYRGVWQPSIIGTSGTAVHTYSQQLGWYSRVGSLVTAYFRIAITAKDAAMAGNTLISGLPFTCLADSLYSGTAVFAEYKIDLTSGYAELGGETNAGTAQIAITQMGDNIAPLFLPAAGVIATSSLVGFVSYITDEA